MEKIISNTIRSSFSKNLRILEELLTFFEHFAISEIRHFIKQLFLVAWSHNYEFRTVVSIIVTRSRLALCLAKQTVIDFIAPKAADK